MDSKANTFGKGTGMLTMMKKAADKKGDDTTRLHKKSAVDDDARRRHMSVTDLTEITRSRTKSMASAIVEGGRKSLSRAKSFFKKDTTFDDLVDRFELQGLEPVPAAGMSVSDVVLRNPTNSASSRHHVALNRTPSQGRSKRPFPSPGEDKFQPRSSFGDGELDHIMVHDLEGGNKVRKNLSDVVWKGAPSPTWPGATFTHEEAGVRAKAKALKDAKAATDKDTVQDTDTIRPLPPAPEIPPKSYLRSKKSIQVDLGLGRAPSTGAKGGRSSTMPVKVTKGVVNHRPGQRSATDPRVVKSTAGALARLPKGQTENGGNRSVSATRNVSQQFEQELRASNAFANVKSAPPPKPNIPSSGFPASVNAPNCSTVKPVLPPRGASLDLRATRSSIDLRQPTAWVLDPATPARLDATSWVLDPPTPPRPAPIVSRNTVDPGYPQVICSMLRDKATRNNHTGKWELTHQGIMLLEGIVKKSYVPDQCIQAPRKMRSNNPFNPPSETAPVNQSSTTCPVVRKAPSTTSIRSRDPPSPGHWVMKKGSSTIALSVAATPAPEVGTYKNASPVPRLKELHDEAFEFDGPDFNIREKGFLKEILEAGKNVDTPKKEEMERSKRFNDFLDKVENEDGFLDTLDTVNMHGVDEVSYQNVKDKVLKK